MCIERDCERCSTRNIIFLNGMGNDLGRLFPLCPMLTRTPRYLLSGGDIE